MALFAEHRTAARRAGVVATLAGVALGLLGGWSVLTDQTRGPYAGVLAIAVGLGGIAVGGYLWWSARWLGRHPDRPPGPVEERAARRAHEQRRTG